MRRLEICEHLRVHIDARNEIFLNYRHILCNVRICDMLTKRLAIRFGSDAKELFLVR
jgi:hypothetical protein